MTPVKMEKTRLELGGNDTSYKHCSPQESIPKPEPRVKPKPTAEPKPKAKPRSRMSDPFRT